MYAIAETLDEEEDDEEASATASVLPLVDGQKKKRKKLMELSEWIELLEGKRLYKVKVR